MRNMRTMLVAGLALLVCVGSAQAAAQLVLTGMSTPATGLISYTVAAVAPTGEQVTNLSDISVTPLSVHHVWPSFDTDGTPFIGDVAAPPFGNAAWDVYDTHILIPQDDLILELGDPVGETNDGTDPAGLGLSIVVGIEYFATTGLGDFGHIPVTEPSTMVFSPAHSVDIIQVVAEVGTTIWLSGGIVHTFEGDTARTDCTIELPEPATMSLLGFGGLLLLKRKRR